MRMRRKRHREERMEACGVLMVTELPQGGWTEVFGNENPVHIEIGCGKGKFVTDMATEHPEINFIAVEKCLDVLVLAMERAKNAQVSNVRFVPGDILTLAELFPEGIGERIYLNFSDPWPKNSTAKRRLTADGFLNLYRKVLKPEGGIWMKTDNRKLFEFSLLSFEQNGFLLKNVCYDLHNSDFQGNVMTEYETRFAEQGMPIHRLEAYVKPQVEAEEKKRGFKLYPVTHAGEECTDYEVKINGQTAELLTTRVSAQPFNRPWPGHQRQKSQTELVNFVSYETDEPVTFEIIPKEPFESVVIRPLSLGIVPEIENGVIRFTVEKPAYFTVEPYGINKALHVFGDPVSSYHLDANDETVIYYGPGEHDAGTIELKSGQTLFIDEGAVVYACVHALDADNIKILGRGILDNSKNHEQILEDESTAKKTFRVFNAYRQHTISLEYCTNIEIEGITIRESLYYNIKPKACVNLHISNVKIIGSWRYNSDGIDTNNCRNVLIENCFIRTFDDGVAVKGMDFIFDDFENEVNKATHRNGKRYDVATNIRTRNCVIWCDYSTGFAVGAETIAEEIYDIVFEDSDVIHITCGAMETHNVDYAHIHDVLFQNINVEYDDVVLTPCRQTSDDHVYENTDPNWTPYLLAVRTVCHKDYSHGTRRGKTDGIVFRNIRMFGKHAPKVKFQGYDEEHMSKNILIENLYHNDELVTEWDSFEVENHGYTEDIRLELNQ